MTLPISLSIIQQWSPDDMDALSGHFTELADRRGDTMDAIQRSASNLKWTGAGNDGKDMAIAEHAATAQTHAQILRATASVAKVGGQALYGQQQLLLEAVQSATSAGFEVGDDFSVTDPDDPMGFREGIAAGIEADLMTQATAFGSQQAATAGEITASTAGLTPGSIQMVDNDTSHDPHVIHATPFPGDLMDRARENPLPESPGKAAPGRAWHVSRSPYGDDFEPQKALEQCSGDRETEDIIKGGLGIAGIASGNAILGVIGSTMGIEGPMKDLFKCEPPEGVH